MKNKSFPAGEEQNMAQKGKQFLNFAVVLKIIIRWRNKGLHRGGVRQKYLINSF